MFQCATRRLLTLSTALLVVPGAGVTSDSAGLTSHGADLATQEAGLATQGAGLPVDSSTSVPSSGERQLDTSALQTVEELSESLANDLLALSVAARDKDRLAIERFFAPGLEAGVFPTQPGDLRSELKWIRVHDWHVADRQVGRDRKDVHHER